MRVLLLAAGRGTRISRYLSGNPKSTVEIGGTSLIAYTVDLFSRKGIDQIGISVGYRQEQIKEHLQDFPVQYFYNPFFDVTNSIASAWFAKDFLDADDDVIIMNGDVFMEEALFDQAIASTANPVMFADGSRKEEADYKFKYSNGLLEKYGKELEGNDITGEYVGVAKIGKHFVQTFMEKLESMISTQKHSVWWENVLYEGIPNNPVHIEETNGLFWAEVDYIEDYERILQFRGYAADFKLL
ncbi:MAG: NTP transferase domain-containing protein [Clostridia bacterium]